MFSWSSNWRWAQCLVASAGLFLLGHLELPDAKSLSIVSGSVESIRVISRKGLGSSNELTVRTADGAQDRVLIARDDLINAAVQGLVGRDVTASVNWSSEAVEFETEGDPSGLAEVVRASASREKKIYDTMAWIALAIGLSLGAVMLTRALRRSPEA